MQELVETSPKTEVEKGVLFIARSLYHNNYYGKSVKNISKGPIVFTIKFTDLLNLEVDDNDTIITKNLAPSGSIFCFLKPISPNEKVRVKSRITLTFENEEEN